MKVLIAILISISLVGCGVAYRQNREELVKTLPESAWGTIPDTHYVLETALIRKMLKDPDSGKFEQVKVYRHLIPSSEFSTTPIPVWVSIVNVNAKNSFGGYTGAKAYWFAWSNGKIIAYIEPGESQWTHIQ